jgi:hypothetical protein
MLFAEVSDLVQIVTALVGLVGTIFAGLMTYYMAKLTKGQIETAKVLEIANKEVKDEVGNVKTTLAVTSSATDKKLDEIHHTVNGNNEKLEARIDSLQKQLKESIKREAKHSPEPRGRVMCGVLRSISNRTITITLDDGTEEPVEVSNGASVTRNGSTLKLKDLQVGDKVEVDDNPAERVEAIGAK